MSAVRARRGIILLFCITAICGHSQVIPSKPVLAYLPHITAGGGFATRITILNLTDASNSVVFNLVSDGGNLLQSAPVTLAANGSTQIETSAERFGTPVKYWAVVGADRAIGVNVFLELRGSGGPTNVLNTIGFNDSALLSNFTIPVEFEPSPAAGAIGRTVGFAAANPHAGSTTVTMRLVNASGVTLATATSTIPGYGQLAIDLATHPNFTTALPRSNLVGTLVVSTTQSVAALALGDDFGPFFASPPLGSGATQISIPHIISGGGFVTKLTIVNLSGSSNTATVTYYNQAGNVTKTSTVSLSPYGAARTSTPESERWSESPTLWARISAPQPISANLFFELLDSRNAVVNTIGFNDATTLSKFVVPVDLLPPPSSSQIGQTAGIALANPSSSGGSATLSLITQQGVTAATSSVSIPAKGQTAVDVMSIPSFRAAVPSSGFHGTLRVEASTPLAAIALGDDWGPFFATPPLVVSSSSPGTLALDGNWFIATASTVYSGVQSMLLGDLAGSAGKSVSGTMHVFDSVCYNPMSNLIFSGQMTGSSVHATSSSVDGQVITVDATVSGTGADLTASGSYSIAGGCANGDRGTLAGYRSAEATGSWSGSAVSNTGATAQVTAQIAQGPTDVDGFYTVSGSAQFSGSPCFTSVGFTDADSLGVGPMVVADMYPAGHASYIEVVLLMEPGGKRLSGNYTVFGGQCDRDAGTFTLTR